VQIVPAKNGWLWVTRGFALFVRAPVIWMLFVMSFVLGVGLLAQVPLLGRVIGIVAMPLFIAACMGLCRNLEARQPLTTAFLLGGLRGHLAALTALGVVYFALIGAVFAISALADGGLLFRTFFLEGRLDPQLFEDARVTLAGHIAALLLVLVGMGYWFAPMLAALSGMGAAKALFFSIFATLRNWRACIVYTFGMGLVAMTVISVFFAAAGLGMPEAALQQLFFLFTLIFMALLFASMYPGYRDVFPDTPRNEETRDTV